MFSLLSNRGYCLINKKVKTLMDVSNQALVNQRLQLLLVEAGWVGKKLAK